MKKLEVAIVGHGFVGKAVEVGFTNHKCNLHIIDPKLGTDVTDLHNKPIDVTFVCVPTPMGDDGSINATIAESVIKDLIENVSGFIVLKSTVTPDIVDSFAQLSDKFIYNPEFLTERNAVQDFLEPKLNVIGSYSSDNATQLSEIYTSYSNCSPCPFIYVTPPEASFIKYSINNFLALKVAWFNELYDLISDNNCNYDAIINGMSHDPRIGLSHMQVPGPDGKRWAGGACFPKDMSAFKRFDVGGRLQIQRQAIKSNNAGRSQYELDEREKEQQVKF